MNINSMVRWPPIKIACGRYCSTIRNECQFLPSLFTKGMPTEGSSGGRRTEAVSVMMHCSQKNHHQHHNK